MKKDYSSPEFLLLRVEINDVILASPESFKDYIDDGGDWGDAGAEFFDDAKSW